MRTHVLMLIGVAALAAGCDQASEQFDTEFDKNFRASCASSAIEGGVPSEIANKACDCSLAKINEKYGASDKLTMSGEQVQPIMVECMNEAMPG